MKADIGAPSLIFGISIKFVSRNGEKEKERSTSNSDWTMTYGLNRSQTLSAMHSTLWLFYSSIF